MTGYILPEDILQKLIQIGSHESFSELNVIGNEQELSYHSRMMVQHWQFWYPIVESLTPEDLRSLIKSLTIAETQLKGWSGGSVSGVIWLFNKYNPPSGKDKKELTDWILRHTHNDWVPFSNFGARSLKEYESLRSMHYLRKQKAQIAEDQRKLASAKKRSTDSTYKLFPAISRGDSKAVVALINKGADINCKSKDGHTPIEWAQKHGKKDICDLLKSKRRIEQI